MWGSLFGCRDRVVHDESTIDPTVGTFARTLTLSGYVITEFSRHEDHVLCRCSRIDTFGVPVRYLFALTDGTSYTKEIRDHIEHVGEHERRVTVLIARMEGDGICSWPDFVDALGGAVPTWRAVTDSYAADLNVLATNQLPAGYEGEAWFLFEEAVADGLEFLLGRRVTRLGGKQRGKDLPDSVALTHDRAIIVVDSKASSQPFSVNVTSLRPLQDYVQNQKLREQGAPQAAGVLVAKSFKQDTSEVISEGNRFLSDAGVPLSLLTVETLLQMIGLARVNPTLRNGVSWKKVFCRVGRIESDILRQEFDRVRLLRQRQ
jgi:hypothetical protein